jgi:hypothetical protein
VAPQPFGLGVVLMPFATAGIGIGSDSFIGIGR